MNFTPSLTCIVGLVFIATLFGIGLYLVMRRTPKPEEGAGFAQPLPYSPPPASPGQPAEAQPQVIYVREPPKKRGLLSRPIDWIALALIIIIAAGFIIPRLVGGYTPEEMGAHKITYQVRGVASASLTLMNGSGGMEQRVLSLPVHVTYDMDSGSMVSLVAQKQSDGGTIICEVFDRDTLWLTSTSTAPYGLCMVSGMVGYK